MKTNEHNHKLEEYKKWKAFFALTFKKLNTKKIYSFARTTSNN